MCSLRTCFDNGDQSTSTHPARRSAVPIALECQFEPPVNVMRPVHGIGFTPFDDSI